MGKKVAMVQSSYIPWKGYFDIINSVDEFILLDDLQYSRSNWRNRNIIKSHQGPRWLTIPVRIKGRLPQKIKDTVISDPRWNQRHWKTIINCYAKANYFRDFKDLFEELYLRANEEYLSEINYRFIHAICQILGISTKMSWSMDYHLIEEKTARLISLCQQACATEYVSGPSAKSYIDEELFRSAKIKLTYMDYSGYPEYNQLYPPFEHRVSIIDLIFNEGLDATRYMKSFNR